MIAQAGSSEAGRRFTAERAANELRIMPACFVVFGTTDASAFDLEGPVPVVPVSNASRSAQRRAIDLAAAQHLNAGQLGRRLAGYGALSTVGSPCTIVDQMQSWFDGGACDGFIILFSDLLQGLDNFVTLVVPELRRRGLFRKAYETATLREHLGPARVPNRRFDPPTKQRT